MVRYWAPIESTGSYVTIPAPLDVMPVLERLD